MKIALFGATGRSGRALIAAALERGVEIRAHARDASKLQEYATAIEIIEGSLNDPKIVAETISGCDSAISALGTVIRQPNTVLSDMSETIAAELCNAGISRFVCITSLGVGDSLPQVKGFVMRTLIKTVAKHIWADKDRQEQVIKSAGLDYLFVRPGGLTDEPASGSIRVLGASAPNGGGSQRISRHDVAAFCVDEAIAPTLYKAAVTLLPGLD